MKIAYINGICKNYDAISNAVRNEISWLIDAGHEVYLFAYACDHADLPFIRVEKESDIIFHQFFQSCDLAIFHFGVYYPLFNLLPVVPKYAKRIVVFHNITPKEFLPLSDHNLIDRSFSQMTNISFADYVICDSEINQRLLKEAGVVIPSTVIPLSFHSKLQTPLQKPSFDDHIVRIVFLSRFVKSKGLTDLLEALFKVMAEEGNLQIEMDFIGNLDFSDKHIVNEVQVFTESIQTKFPHRITARIHGNALDVEKEKILYNADLLVLPTYHEGFCIPILEALSSGCLVVTYDNSNTPAISGGLATLVPTGDTNCLARAMIDSICLALASHWKCGGYHQHLKQINAHINQFSPNVVKQQYLEFINKQCS